MPAISEACPACKTPVESTCGDTDILKVLLQSHFSVCKRMLERQTGHPTVGQQKPKLVNVCRLDKMEVKDKPHGMQAADWIRFEERWNLWKADQPPEQNLSIYLLDLFPNARKEITNKLSSPYKEDDILRAAKEVLIVQTNTGIASSLFNRITQQYSKSVESFVSRVQDAAIPCDFRQLCEGCNKYLDYTDRMIRD